METPAYCNFSFISLNKGLLESIAWNSLTKKEIRVFIYLYSCLQWYYDKKSVFKVGNYKFFWQLVNYNERKDGIESVIFHAMVNCDNYETRWLTNTSYSRKMGKGRIVMEFIVPEDIPEEFDWTYYHPKNTTQGIVLKKVCELR